MKGDEAEGSIITFRRRGKAEKRPVPLAEQPRMQTTNPERLLGRLLTHGAKLLVQLTKQSLFRPWQERQRREQTSEGKEHHGPVASCDKSKTQARRLRPPPGCSREIGLQNSREPERSSGCSNKNCQMRSAAMTRAERTAQAIPRQETPNTMVLARLA